MDRINGKHVTAIVLAAGQGKRMQSKIQKQYMLLKDKPVIYYSLQAFEESFVDHIVLVVGKGEIQYCKENIVDAFGFGKVAKIVEGGKERYHSVAAGIDAIEWECDYCMIHDGARPFITNDILERALETVQETDACVVGMPIKDTIKIVDEDKNVVSTPTRSLVWQVQTPQTFAYSLISESYHSLIVEEEKLIEKGIQITDDAMVVEYFTNTKVRLVEGSYQNIKITTPDDLYIGEQILSKREN